MNKEEFTLFENIKRLDNDMQKEVNLFNLFLNLYFTSTLKSGTIIKKEGRI